MTFGKNKFMKKTILLLTIILVSFFLQAQKKDSIPPVSDTAELVSIKQINEVLTTMRKNLSLEEAGIYQLLLNECNRIIMEARIKRSKRKN